MGIVVGRRRARRRREGRWVWKVMMVVRPMLEVSSRYFACGAVAGPQPCTNREEFS